MEPRERRERGNETAARSGHLSGRNDYSKSNQTDDITRGASKGRLRVIEAEADALERGAAILAKSGLGAGPALEQLGRALELLMRGEAERKRLKLRNGRSLAQMFPDEMPA